MPPPTPRQGQALVKLARLHIEQELSGKKAPMPPMDENDPCFHSYCGTFVTLKKKGALRGCIGNLVGRHTIWESVWQNAANAAFGDPRFPEVTQDELDDIEIEVSILSTLQRLDFTDSGDLLGKLRPHIDGVTISKGMASATFLPQVWEQLPKKKAFLEHLCLKAGLQADAWKRPGLDVSTYQAQYFDEEK